MEGEKTVRQAIKGEWFTLKPIAHPKADQVWVRDEYDHSTQKYTIINYGDISNSRQVSGDRTVYTDFVF